MELIGDKVIIPNKVIVKTNKGGLAKDDTSISLDDVYDIIDDNLGAQPLELPTLPDKDNALTQESADDLVNIDIEQALYKDCKYIKYYDSYNKII